MPTGFRSRELVPVPVLVPGPDITVVVVERSSRGDARLGREGSARDVHAHLPRFPREYLRESFVGRARRRRASPGGGEDDGGGDVPGKEPPDGATHRRRASPRASRLRPRVGGEGVSTRVGNLPGRSHAHHVERGRVHGDAPRQPRKAEVRHGLAVRTDARGAQHDRLCVQRTPRRAPRPLPRRRDHFHRRGSPRGKTQFHARARGGLCVGTTRTYAAFTAAKCDMSSTYSCTASTADQSSPSAPSRASTACNPASALAAAAHAASVGFAAGTEALTWTTGAAEPPNARTRGAPVVVPVASAAAAAAAASRRVARGGGGRGTPRRSLRPRVKRRPLRHRPRRRPWRRSPPAPRAVPGGLGARGRAPGGGWGVLSATT